ncbi:metal ABC transporter permease [Aneurinibacillus sp. Ricciae_BoGa-3]|uniref:metal ABC transporter permease n=1 Tax=Aneurinibacillus sp. Ricciae_BoGa-3 TaxID=3022697 RepID=UPI002342810C|nr:metal ABC transporter permease [Aneurinibacillus sp. Ricciae_BoGa-3]WCK52776.1 metal ABC transporter permease [Aneurinibacillus sp. Ricciae_BoGa-3]
MFEFDFMQHAFLAGTMVAIMCGVIGVYVITRGLSFIAHMFSEIGFSGATFAVFMGWNPLYGLLCFTTISSLAIGQLGVKVFRRDLSINVILSIFLGLGLLFLSLSSRQSSAAFSLLFGSVVGISAEQVWQITGLSIGVLVLLLLGYRMLTFDSYDPVGAEAAGLPVKFISMAFLLLLSIAVVGAVQIVGSLLVFTLMTTPAATARHLTKSISRMILFSAIIAMLGVWAGLVLGYYTNAPVSFFITATEGIFYFAALGWRNFRERIQPQTENRLSLAKRS